MLGLRKNQEKTLKMNGKTGESNSSNSSLSLGVRRRCPSRRLAGAMLKELLPVPTSYNPQSLTSLSLSKFQNLEIFLSKVQTLTSLHSRLWPWHNTAAARPQQPRDAAIYFPYPKVRNPAPPFLFYSLLPSLLFSFFFNLDSPNFNILNLFFPFFWVMS